MILCPNSKAGILVVSFLVELVRDEEGNPWGIDHIGKMLCKSQHIVRASLNSYNALSDLVRETCCSFTYYVFYMLKVNIQH